MSIGLRVVTKINRPDPALVEQFRSIPVANLDDNMGRIYSMDSGIRPINPDAVLCGPAFTVKCPSGDNLMFHKALSMFEPGDVLVISGVGNSERSLCGSLMLNDAIGHGLAGMVLEGYIRDYDGYRESHFPVYARGIQPNGPYKNGPGEINVPVAVGGQVVMPGDIIVGDADGVIVIPQKDAEYVLEKARATLERETKAFEAYARGEIRPRGPREWVEKKLSELGVEIID